MHEIEAIAGIALQVVAIAGFVIALVWLNRGEGGSLADLFRYPINPPLPRGIQEEEPVRWHVERLRRPPRSDAHAIGATQRQPIDCSPRVRLPSTD